MEGQSPADNSQYKYQSAQWSRLVRRNTLADTPPNLPPNLAPAPQLSTQLELLPILLPQQPSYHQGQLAHYNRLITSGRATPLPPLLSAQHIQAVPGSRPGSRPSSRPPSRPSSSSGNTAKSTKFSARGGHGNKESRKSSQGEPTLMTHKESSATMPGKKLDLSNQLPNRPLIQHQNTNFSQQSSSVPSTPHQHARQFSFESREPSPNAVNSHSPRSAYSESNITLPSRVISSGGPRGGCRYETAMAHTKRRIPYSIGSERLEKLSASSIKSKLSQDEERALSTDMRELYDRLLPTKDSEDRRKKLVQKLEKLFNEEWPGHDIQVHVFGSSGNLLCTDESDVDVCITTNWKELEGVCIIAELLAKNGMEKVICVSTAKVPIVKIWDPETRLACDMNVNNVEALENTRMIKTYVQIDPRVRQLAMIIKHWTKRRIVNDAGFGLTISSYTWICMIINFLQSRSPPILPALHQRPHLKLPVKGGQGSEFADDLDALQGFGKKNKETVGELLFQFFRFYGHEFDYDKHVVSVRNGKQISKVEKKWHLGNNNILCVEEPFKVVRNLGNTADETSFRGLHLEIRRAFNLISQAKLEECCEQYQYPKEEERIWEKPAPKPKPILRSTSQSSRGGRGAHRGNRHTNRNGNNNRRSSSSTFDGSSYNGGLPPNMTAQDVWLQRQAQAQLHNDLYTTYSVLQAQENSLRMQLYNQSQGYMQAQQSPGYSQSQPGQSSTGGIKHQTADRNRTSSFDQAPFTAPLRNEMYFYPLPYPGSPMYGYQSPTTNPSSPSLTAAIPELRRSMHRSSITNGSGAGGQSSSSMRSHSQPAARSTPSQLSVPGLPNSGLGIYQTSRQANGAPIPSFIADENSEASFESNASISTTPPEDNTPKEYVGYYVNESAPSSRRREPNIMAIPSFGDLYQSRRRLSTDRLPQSILDRMKRPSRSPSPLGHDRSFSTGARSAPLCAVPSQQSVSSSNLRALNQGPLVVNGSNVPAPVSIPNWQASVSVSSRAVEGSDIPIGPMDSMSLASVSDNLGDQDHSGQVTPKEYRSEGRVEPPMVVNGSNPQTYEVSPTNSGPVPSNINIPSGLTAADLFNHPRLSPNSRNRLARQNGGMSPLDIGASQSELPRDETSHLSPVFETRTPSPTTSRKFESLTDRRANGHLARISADKNDLLKSAQNLGVANGSQSKSPSGAQNGHTRGAKSEGSGPGTWQKAPNSKGKKKGPSADTKGTTSGQAQGERLPKDDSERKGG
ncbi:Poly(A) RNA polymerase [Lachnellula willkommii]|uniref:polynucleotide adenylyltransferase n=1 Tax=Lachnellula willkommii TaxID=215461 RepID=A0A559MIW5_9HELO|nr:Poly(A) RNA polymerase [Lachnellula willkommii]